MRHCPPLLASEHAVSLVAVPATPVAFRECARSSRGPMHTHAAPYLTSRPLQPCAAFPTAFNNTAVQYVRASALAEWDSDWWTLPPPVGTAAKEGAGTSEAVPSAGPGDAIATSETGPYPQPNERPQVGGGGGGGAEASPTSAPRSATPTSEAALGASQSLEASA